MGEAYRGQQRTEAIRTQPQSRQLQPAANAGLCHGVISHFRNLHARREPRENHVHISIKAKAFSDYDFKNRLRAFD